MCSGRGAPGKSTISSGNSGRRGTGSFYSRNAEAGRFAAAEEREYRRNRTSSPRSPESNDIVGVRMGLWDCLKPRLAKVVEILLRADTRNSCSREYPEFSFGRVNEE